MIRTRDDSYDQSCGLGIFGLTPPVADYIGLRVYRSADEIQRGPPPAWGETPVIWSIQPEIKAWVLAAQVNLARSLK